MDVTDEQLKNMTPEQIAALQKQNCPFCHIASGRIPSKKVYEDGKVLAVLDINPAVRGHIILFTKEHYQIMPQMPEESVSYLFMIAKGLCKTEFRALGVRGTNIFVANGAVAGQKAPHFMIHIIPREDKDGINLSLPRNRITKEMLAKIKRQLLKKGSSEVDAEILEEKPGDKQHAIGSRKEEKNPAVSSEEEELESRKEEPDSRKKINLDDITSLFS